LDPRDKTLNIVIVGPNPLRSAILRDGLQEAGYQRVALIDDIRQLARQLSGGAPDVILIDLENPSRDVLEQMFQMSRALRRPIAMFVDQSDSFMIEAAVDAGVGAFIVNGLTKSRVRSILELTISRFNALARLQRELDEAKSALADRKVIDKAKGILMKRKQLGEEQAYGLLRQSAMNQNRKVVDVAQSIITAAELLD
jgi:response regulator NasT